MPTARRVAAVLMLISGVTHVAQLAFYGAETSAIGASLFGVVYFVLGLLLLGKGRVVHATHQQLADELGSVREMISRLLKGFSEQGLVGLGREQIEIRDAAGLRRVAEAV